MNCKTCGNEVLEKYSRYASGNYCSKHCAKLFAATFNKKESSKKTSETLKNKPQRETVCKKCGKPTFTRCTSPIVYCNDCRQLPNPKSGNYSVNRKYCNRCGAIRGTCKHPALCRKNLGLFNNLEKYFGFDKTSFGSERYYEEIFRIKAMIEEDYFNNELSITELATKYGHDNFGNFSKLLSSIGIIFRTCQKATQLNYKLGKCTPRSSTIYKHGWHISWDDKKVFYRSSYEEEYAKQLDKQKIKYEMETLRVWYFDTQRCIDRIAVPDFYLPETNTIVEIKSSYTYNEQNMNDKIKAYKKHGYNFKLILDHKETECSLM